VLDVSATESPWTGKNQRATVRMTATEIAQFLAGPHTAAVSTLNRDGTIHSTALFYGLIDGSIAFETKAVSQKVRNLERNPTITCLVEEGKEYAELRGVSVVGRAELLHDATRLFEFTVAMHERYQGPCDDATLEMLRRATHRRVLVEIHVDRMISWDHRKLGLASEGSTRS
jgi:PPOX class probable F420-dependent enzyme